MKKKRQKAQIILILIGFFLISITYFYYPYIKETELVKDQSEQKDLKEKTDDDRQAHDGNVIEPLEWIIRVQPDAGPSKDRLH